MVFGLLLALGAALVRVRLPGGLAVAISALILLGWTWASNRYFPPAKPPASTKVVNGQQQPLPQPGTQPAANAPKALQSRGLLIKTINEYLKATGL